MKYVTVISAPISERMWTKGEVAKLDEENAKIRVGGNWFDFDERWEIE